MNRWCPECGSRLTVETSRGGIPRQVCPDCGGDPADRVDADDAGWSYLTFHDLRRTWATALASADVDPLLVCDWGGWNDPETFLDHYRGTYAPEAQERERQKVDWL